MTFRLLEEMPTCTRCSCSALPGDRCRQEASGSKLWRGIPEARWAVAAVVQLSARWDKATQRENGFAQTQGSSKKTLLPLYFTTDERVSTRPPGQRLPRSKVDPRAAALSGRDSCMRDL